METYFVHVVARKCYVHDIDLRILRMDLALHGALQALQCDVRDSSADVNVGMAPRSITPAELWGCVFSETLVWALTAGLVDIASPGLEAAVQALSDPLSSVVQKVLEEILGLSIDEALSRCGRKNP